MAARAIGNATISFGLVSIPVKLFTSTRSSETISFRMLHDKCKTPLKQRYWCEQDSETVTRDATIKGYEYAKGQYVPFTPDELKAMEEAATKAIAIEEFVPLAAIDGVYYDKAYYLAPERGGQRAHNLLAAALRQRNLGGLAKYAARGKQYLVVVRPVEDGLVMQQLRYANEVRAFSELELDDDVEVKEGELELALQIIDQTTSESFEPQKYHDEVRGRIEDAIQQKVDGQEIAFAPEESPQAQVIDLMEALKASLAAKTDRKPAKASARAKSETKKVAAGGRKKSAR